MCDRGLTAGILNAKSQSKMEVRRQRSAVRSPRRPPTSPVPNSNSRNSTILRLRRAIPKNRAFSANFSLLRFLRLLLFKFPVFTALENTPCPGVSVVNSPPFFAICSLRLLPSPQHRRQRSAPVLGRSKGRMLLTRSSFSRLFGILTLLRPGTGALRYCRVSHRPLCKYILVSFCGFGPFWLRLSLSVVLFPRTAHFRKNLFSVCSL